MDEEDAKYQFPMGKVKDIAGEVYSEDGCRMYQFPMGKVKNEKNELLKKYYPVSIPNGKGKEQDLVL